VSVEELGRAALVRGRSGLSKVPAVTGLFWVIKVLTTGMGETTSDFLVKRYQPELAVAVVGLIFLGSLLLQLAATRYRPFVYWFAVVMVSVFGTMAADVLHVGLGVPYVASTIAFAVILTVIFVLWYRTEGTLSIQSIRTRRRELFYWATVLATFALGTALGDLTATTLHLGYFASGVLFAVVFMVPAVAYRLGWMGGVLAFWIAYVTTRPLGASFADWLGVPQKRGGLDVGTGLVSVVAAVVIVLLVTVLAVTRSDVHMDEV
jgi:uncharacterized membrane-anchored protein